MLDIASAPLQAGLLIGGEWRAGAETLPVENPSTGEIVGEITAGGRGRDRRGGGRGAQGV